MCPQNEGGAPVVEASPAGDAPDLTLRALHQRIRQEEILGELGVTALQGADFDKLLAETARLTAEALRAEFCKVLEHIPTENRLVVRAGVGWDEGIVGTASVGADLASPATGRAPSPWGPAFNPVVDVAVGPRLQNGPRHNCHHSVMTNRVAAMHAKTFAKRPISHGPGKLWWNFGWRQDFKGGPLRPPLILCRSVPFRLGTTADLRMALAGIEPAKALSRQTNS
jgi:hypothetical protein